MDVSLSLSLACPNSPLRGGSGGKCWSLSKENYIHIMKIMNKFHILAAPPNKPQGSKREKKVAAYSPENTTEGR